MPHSSTIYIVIVGAVGGTFTMRLFPKMEVPPARRLNAMRTLEVVPEVREKILANMLSLNDVAKTQGYINKVNRSTIEPLSTKEQREFFDVAEKVSAKELESALANKHDEIESQRAQDHCDD